METPEPAPPRLAPPPDQRHSTMRLMIDTIREMNEKSLDTIAAQSSSNSRRMWLIILLVIIVLAAAIGVTASIQLPGDVVIGATQ